MAVIDIDIDSDLKTKAQAVLDDLGLDMSTAVNGFLEQVVYKKTIPYELIKLHVHAKSPKKKAKLGGWEGKIFMSNDFNEPMEEFKEYTE